MDNVFMIVAIAIVIYVFYNLLNNKPVLPFLKKNNKKKQAQKQKEEQLTEIDLTFEQLLGVKQFGKHIVEMESVNNSRVFNGFLHAGPINYDLKSFEERQGTDEAYERLLSKLNLGIGREVNITIHVQSRPIELIDNIKPFRDNIQNMSVAEREYAENFFFPYLKTYEQNVEMYHLERYFKVELYYSSNLTDEQDEEFIWKRANNEFNRLATSIISEYGKMGGVAKKLDLRGIIEMHYFAIYKNEGTTERLRRYFTEEGKLLDGALSQIVRPYYDEESRSGLKLDEAFDDEEDTVNKEETHAEAI